MRRPQRLDVIQAEPAFLLHDQESSMEKVVSDEFNENDEYGLYNEYNENHEYYYYYFPTELYTDENINLLPNKLSGAYSDFLSFIKNSKIPKYAKDYKREYLFLIGLNYEFRYFRYKPEDVSFYEFFHNLHVKKIIKLLKTFLRNQEKGIFSKDLNGLKLKKKDIFHLIYFSNNIISKILRTNKEKKFLNNEINFKLNNYFNFVYIQIIKKIIDK